MQQLVEIIAEERKKERTPFWIRRLKSFTGSNVSGADSGNSKAFVAKETENKRKKKAAKKQTNKQKNRRWHATHLNVYQFGQLFTVTLNERSKNKSGTIQYSTYLKHCVNVLSNHPRTSVLAENKRRQMPRTLNLRLWWKIMLQHIWPRKMNTEKLPYEWNRPTGRYKKMKVSCFFFLGVCCRHFDDIPHRMVHFYIGGGPPKKQQQQQIVDRNGALKTFYVNPSLDWSRRITIFSKGLMKCKRGEIKKKVSESFEDWFPFSC